MPKTSNNDIPPVAKRKLSSLENLQFVVLFCAILYFGKTLFIPLSFSLLVSFILYPICIWLEKKGINKIISIFLALFGLILLLLSILYLLFDQITAFANEWETFSHKFLEAITQISAYLDQKMAISVERQSLYIKNFVTTLEIWPLLKNMLYSFSEVLFILISFPIFSALLLYYRHLLITVLYQIFATHKPEIIQEIILQTITEYYNFIKGMLIVYLSVGLLNSIGLAIIGIPHPFLFGFIASILTFIPYVGIIISSLLPISISWITYNSIWYPIGVIAVFTIVQFLEAYILFPLAVGNRLKINALVIIVVIIAGGIIWGAAGMILFIPFVSILKLIADRTKDLKSLSLLLGDGKLN
jgi:predicted PurR-regulated permease PerM